MFRHFRIIPLLLVCLMAPLNLYAEESPVIYTIQQGDTLWGCLNGFFRTPAIGRICGQKTPG